ncbi:hypothetical protein [Blastochloris tepida]|uniref:Uncharacterized protein n=1 Tax=Blastochloris tepida TaxID=2233851 RepID=A0A348G1G3_9HYPH|nr:hypothetical protein [Blastochloris tepida]BBF93396.1 hypothetical protein BLTE_20810 [Blastochloris tepida]
MAPPIEPHPRLLPFLVRHIDHHELVCPVITGGEVVCVRYRLDPGAVLMFAGEFGVAAAHVIRRAGIDLRRRATARPAS